MFCIVFILWLFVDILLLYVYMFFSNMYHFSQFGHSIVPFSLFMKVISYDFFYDYYKFYSRLIFCIIYHYNIFAIVGSANVISVFSKDTIKPTF